MDKRDYKIEQVTTVLDDEDERLLLKKNQDRYISLSEAREIYGDDIDVEDELRSEFNIEDYGRTASANLVSGASISHPEESRESSIR